MEVPWSLVLSCRLRERCIGSLSLHGVPAPTARIPIQTIVLDTWNDAGPWPHIVYCLSREIAARLSRGPAKRHHVIPHARSTQTERGLLNRQPSCRVFRAAQSTETIEYGGRNTASIASK